jgi:hypothetical protein
MKATERLERLENAHRALAAKHEALHACCRVMLPFVKVENSVKQRLMTSAYDAINEHMDKAKHDDEYQQLVRGAFDEIADSILVIV